MGYLSFLSSGTCQYHRQETVFSRVYTYLGDRDVSAEDVCL